MKRLFLDSSALFSAIYTSRGYARDLLLLATRGKIGLILSNLVVEEVHRNLAEQAPETIDVFLFFLSLIPFEISNPSREEVQRAAEHIVLIDAPILAAALRSQADMLVTLDKQHLLGNPELERTFGVQIVTPETAIANLG